jgi:HK97 family phage major capsid protein
MESRSFEVDVGSVRGEERLFEASLSSEFAVMRRGVEEVLEHTTMAIDLSRAPLPLLRAHNIDELPVGVVTNIRIEGGKLRGTIKISENQSGLWSDIRGGVIRNLSIGYKILEKVKTKRGFIAKRWMPYEVSLVGVPADSTVGVNRSITKKENKIMDKNDILKAKKAAVEEMTELAKTGEDNERMDALRGDIRFFDSRLDALEVAGKSKPEGFVPDTRNTAKVDSRSYSGLFGAVDRNDEEVRAFYRTMTEGIPTAGGFSVPSPLASQWLDSSIESEIIRPRASVYPMSSDTLAIPGWDTHDQSAGKIGGFQMEMLSETGGGTGQSGLVRLVTLASKKGAIFVDVSSELNDDSPAFGGQLDAALRASIGNGLDHLFINGVGGAEPIGLRNDAAKIQVTPEVAQVAGTLVYENFTKMFSRMYSAGRKRGVWLINDSAIPQLLSLSIAIGTGGSHVPVLSESGGEFRILTRPVIFTSHMPALGSADDVLFCDLSQYAVGLRKNVKMEKSNIPGWANDLQSYRVILRFDGLGLWNAPLTPRNGATQSWVVGLGAR